VPPHPHPRHRRRRLHRQRGRARAARAHRGLRRRARRAHLRRRPRQPARRPARRADRGRRRRPRGRARPLRDRPPARVLHLAAESHVDRSIDGPLAFVRTNLSAPRSCSRPPAPTGRSRGAAARRVPLRPRQHRRGLRQPRRRGRFTTATPYDPRSPYSASKAGSDHLARAWHHTFGLPVVVTNCSNNYGPRQHPEKLIPHMILRALAGERCRSTARRQRARLAPRRRPRPRPRRRGAARRPRRHLPVRRRRRAHQPRRRARALPPARRAPARRRARTSG
jgi:hypothetical protein